VVEVAELNDLLDRLARRFEDAAQVPGEEKDARGWGQFLDAPKRHSQIGPYGTSAGIIVLSLAGRGQSALTKQATALLSHWWQRREDDKYVQRRFVQTTRLAFLHLALRLSGIPDTEETRAEVERALIERLLPYGMWGNYWLTSNKYDPTPRLFSSAIALLSFTLLREASLPANENVISVADRLEEKLTLPRRPPLLEAAAASAAILSAKGSLIGRRTVSRVADSALSNRPGLDERGVYFYDYEYSPDVQGETRFGRDFFIIPTEILLAIAGFQPGAPSSARLMAEDVLRVLVENLRHNEGVYRPAEGERLSCVDQAWAAILLKVSSVGHKPLSVREKLYYALFRRRREGWFMNRVFPGLSMLFVTLSNVLLKDTGPVNSVIAAVATLIIGGFYGPAVLRKLIPGRE
jgi:hypothetical protein